MVIIMILNSLLFSTTVDFNMQTCNIYNITITFIQKSLHLFCIYIYIHEFYAQTPSKVTKVRLKLNIFEGSEPLEATSKMCKYLISGTSRFRNRAGLCIV